jgi:hypothetical protein
MAEPAESMAASPTQSETREAIREQLARLRLELAELGYYETQLAATEHKRELRRVAVDIGGALAVALALLTAFGLANAAAVRGLTTAMSGWAAALVLAGAWIAAGAVLAFALWLRAERGKGLKWWRMLTGVPADELRDVEQSRAQAERAVRETLERLAPAASKEVASAVVPMASAVAGEMAGEMAAGVVDAGGDLLEGSDDLVESVTEEMPAGGIINQIWDVALMPGRFGVRVATTVLKRPPSSG